MTDPSGRYRFVPQGPDAFEVFESGTKDAVATIRRVGDVRNRNCPWEASVAESRLTGSFDQLARKVVELLATKVSPATLTAHQPSHARARRAMGMH